MIMIIRSQSHASVIQNNQNYADENVNTDNCSSPTAIMISTPSSPKAKVGSKGLSVKVRDKHSLRDNIGNGQSNRLKRNSIQCFIVGSEIKSSKFMHYTLYHVEVKHVSISGQVLSTNFITRRYSQFAKLHSLLSCIYPYLILPPLPIKHYFQTTDPSIVNSRRRLLQSWLNAVCNMAALATEGLVQLFLTVDNVGFSRACKVAERSQPNVSLAMIPIFSPRSATLTSPIESIASIVSVNIHSADDLDLSYVAKLTSVISIPSSNIYSCTGYLYSNILKYVSSLPTGLSEDHHAMTCLLDEPALNLLFTAWHSESEQLRNYSYGLVISVIDLLGIQKLQVREVESARRRITTYQKYLNSIKEEIARREAKLLKSQVDPSTSKDVQDLKEQYARLEIAVRTLSTAFIEQFEDWKRQRKVATVEIIKQWAMLNIQFHKEQITLWTNTLLELKSVEEEQSLLEHGQS